MKNPLDAMSDLDAPMPAVEGGNKAKVDLKKLEQEIQKEMGALDLGNMG